MPVSPRLSRTAPAASASRPDGTALDPAEAQAFTDQARWLHASHDRRSEIIGQRAANLLGFTGVITALMPAAIGLGKGHVRYAWPIKITAVTVLVLLIVTAATCLRVLALRQASVQNGAQLRDQWDRYTHGKFRGLVQAQIAHSFLGGDPALDPVATSKAEADSRARAYKWSVRLMFTALVVLSALATQILLQQA